MATTTSNRGHSYPQSSDDFRPYEDIEELAKDVDADVEAMATGVYAHIFNSVAQSIANAIRVQGAFDTAALDVPGGQCNTGSDRIDIVQNGVYVITAQATFVNNATGYRGVSIYRNASADHLAITMVGAANGQATRVQATSPPRRLFVADDIRIGLFQSSGGALNTEITSGGVWLAIQRIAD